MARHKRLAQQKRAQPSRKEILRQRKSARERRVLLTVLVPIVALVVIIVGGGAFRELVQKPRQPVARVEGHTIPASAYMNRLAYERLQLLNSLQSFAQFAQVSSGQDNFLRQFGEQSRQGLPNRTVDTLIDEVLIRKEAALRNIEVTDEDVRAEIYSQLPSTRALEAQATPVDETSAVTDTLAITSTDGVELTSGVTGTTGVTDSAAARPTLSAELARGATLEADRDYETVIRQGVLQRTGLSESEYFDIVRNQLLREKLQEEMGKEVATTGEQAEVAYLAFASRSTAEEAAAALAGGVEWAEIVSRYRAPEASEAISGTGTAQLELATAEPPPPATATLALEPAGPGEPLTGTAAISATTAITSAVPVSPTAAAPLPTATPDPYWAAEGEREWQSRTGLKEQMGLSDSEATTILEAEPGPLELMDGRQGTYLVYVYAVEEARELTDTEIEARRASALDDWLTTKRVEAQIDRFPVDTVTPPEPDWFVALFEQLVGTSLPAIPESPLQVSTVQVPAQDAATPEATP